MKKQLNKQFLLLFSMGLLICNLAVSQSLSSLSLEDCYKLAAKNYPLVQQNDWITKSQEYSLLNSSKGTLPQITIGGQTTYQSDVTQIPISLPNVKIPSISKDQYKLYGEISQPITDLFTVKYQNDLIKANTMVEQQKTAVELYKIKECINQLYFGIMLIDGQLIQNEILKKDIIAGIDKNKVAIANGIALKSSVDVLKVELLKADQRKTELKAVRKGYADMLSLFINQTIDETTQFEKLNTVSLPTVINRPELQLYDLQMKTIDVQSKLLDTKLLPRFSVFFQGGYGRPGLNMMSNDFELYYIGGVRFSWNINNFYTQKENKKLLDVNQNLLDVQKETFLFNTNLTLKQQQAEIDKIEQLIQSDIKIVQLRESVKHSAQQQLEFGTATTIDYLTYVNAEDQAKQNLILHQIQLLLAQFNYKTTIGN